MTNKPSIIRDIPFGMEIKGMKKSGTNNSMIIVIRYDVVPMAPALSKKTGEWPCKIKEKLSLDILKMRNRAIDSMTVAID